MKKNECVLHGECIVSLSGIPSNAVPKKPRDNSGYMIVADSEVTGNHHVVDLLDGVEFFETSDGGLFMKNSVPTKIRCIKAERHNEIVLEPAEYSFGYQQEYDYFTEALRNVRD
jgi:hypothetical protein